MRYRSSPAPGTLLGALALFVALGGTGYAVITSGVPDENGAFHGCVNHKTGALRVVARGAQCHRGRHRELPIAWSERGPAGPPGHDGANGANGTNGTDGTNGADGRPGTDGSGGTTVVVRARSTAPVTTTSSSQPVALTGATWTQAADELDRPYAEVVYQAPAASDCTSHTGPDLPGTMTVSVSIDGSAVRTLTASAGDTSTRSSQTLAPLLDTGVATGHTITATAIDTCGQGGGAQAAHFVVQSVLVDVASIR